MRITILMIILTFIGCNSKPQTNISYDKRLKAYKYPYKTKLFKFLSQTQQLEMAYMYLEAQPKSDKTIVLLHSQDFSGAYFEEIIKEFSRMNYNVLIPDMIGHGRSSKPNNYQYSLHELSRHINKLINWYSLEKVEVLGHGLGGAIAIRLALSSPDKIERLWLVNPIGLEERKDKYQSIDERYANILKNTPKKITSLHKTKFYNSKWKKNYQRWTNQQIGWINGPDFREVAYTQALIQDMIYTQPIVQDLHKLASETILIMGNHDKTYKSPIKIIEKVKRKIKSLKSIQMERGHLPFIESPIEFMKLFQK